MRRRARYELRRAHEMQLLDRDGARLGDAERARSAGNDREGDEAGVRDDAEGRDAEPSGTEASGL